MRSYLLFLIFILNTFISFSQSNGKGQPPVEGWYFRAISGYPASVAFEPLVFFKDGTYFRVEEEPVSQVDISESKAKNPHLWGTWKRAGDLFTLTNSKGKARQYDLNKGNWFPAFPFNNAISLKGKYEKISGGDYGGGLVALFQSSIVFLDDTHFTNSEDMGVSAYSSHAWKSSKNSGTYKIDQNTIELNYNNGQKVLLSFAIGAEGYDTMDTDMLFIGGKAYVIE